MRRRLNFLAARAYLSRKAASGRDLRVDLDQNEIGQRNQGRCDAARDQGVVGADAGGRIERLVGFLHHFETLGQIGRPPL